jgi:nitrous oxidase accessory protein NosD
VKWIVGVGLFFVLAALAWGATLQVPQDYPTVQAAVDAASPGDEIVVAEGSYKEVLIVTKDIAVRGEGEVVIAPSMIGETLVDVRAGEVVFQNLCFESGWSVGCAITLSGEAWLTLDSCYIRRGAQAMPFATGIQCAGASRLVMRHSRIEGAAEDGVRLMDEAKARVEDCLIASCKRYGLVAWDAAQATGSGNRMEGNGCDLAGNISPGFRISTREAREKEIHFPAPEYASLQEAMDALLPGGVIYLAAGEYLAGVTVEKPLVIRAEEGASPTLTRPVWSGTLLSLISGAQLTLMRVTLKDGSYGILAWGDAVVKVEACSFAGTPCGIYAGPVSRVEISGCDFQEVSYGVFAVGDSQVFLRSVRITGGTYGVVAADESSLAFEDVEISGCWWGVALPSPSCWWGMPGPAPLSQDHHPSISGQVKVRDSQRADLCPPYPGDPWPAGFLVGQ